MIITEKDNLTVKIADSRAEMGKLAGNEIREKIIELQKVKEELNIIFAAAPSQNEVLETLAGAQGIEWSRINAFHMDEYMGLDSDAPQGFGNFLRVRLFDKLPFKNVFYINCGSESAEEKCLRYTKLLDEHPADIVCMGIGENGHIAFNDPGVADFNDKAAVKIVELDEICRQQQVNDGCFAKLDDVPRRALTLTVPALMRCEYVFCSVPAQTKAQAVKNTLTLPISEICPATVLRTHKNAVLYCDNLSAGLVMQDISAQKNGEK